MSRPVAATLALALLCGCGAEGEDPTQPQQSDSGRADSFVVTDAKRDLGVDSTTSSGDSSVTDTSGPITPPPPIEDTASLEDYGPPPAGSRVEGTIGPDGGELAGLTGTPLQGVKLVVPKGALSSTLLFAIDLGSPISGPSGALVSPYVRIAPDGVAFAVPARLTLPWKTTVMSPQLAAIARIGFSWSSLHDPAGDATSITASMRRTSGAAVALIDLTAVAPKVTKRTNTGGTLFLEGSGFGVAQVYRPMTTGDFTSTVKVAGSVVPVIAWSDTTIAVASEAGSGTVTTPGGTASF